jgi:translin
MPSLNDLSEGMIASFDAKDRARERTIRITREVVRLCSSAIRSVHRGNLEDAERLMDKARSSLEDIYNILKDHQDIRFAGFVDVALQEYAEARMVHSITTRHEILTPAEIGVDNVNYLAGLGDATGELRRHVLDLIRRGRPEEGEYFLDVMEEIYHLLMLFDYPEAITRGLRRKSDLARSMLERTRGDLTNAMEMAKVDASLRCHEDKLKDRDMGV